MLSIILPTYNESQNITRVIDAILAVQPECEIIVVDDNSPDGTWCVVEGIQDRYGNVRLMRRITKRGLSSAVADGFREAKGDVLMVLDADGQHDASLIQGMMQKIEQENADVVIGSRYMKGGSVGSWIRDRRIISRIGTRLSQIVSGKHVTDPLSGFFAIKADVYRSIEGKVRVAGFKILLEILGHLEEVHIAEVPLIFRMRRAGESKLSLAIEIEFLGQLCRLACINLPKTLQTIMRKKKEMIGERKKEHEEKSDCKKRDTLKKWHLNVNAERMLKRIEPFMRTLFYGTMLITGAMYLMQWMTILPMYGDSTVRQEVQKILKETGGKEGWLLSGIEIRSITKDEIELRYHDIRRKDEGSAKNCFAIRSTHMLVCEK